MMATMLPESSTDDLASLHRRHYADLVRVAAVLVDHTERAEEIVQDAFVALVRRPGGIATIDDPAAYLRRSVVNGARSALRRRGTRRRHLTLVRPPDDAPAADVDVLRADEHGRVLRALATLPDRQREVLTLRYQLDLSEADIAATLEISTGSVKTHAHRGLERLRTLLEDQR